jgi:hypothetical protein
MNDQSEQPRDITEERAKLFEAMAAQIRLNRDAKFGGAILAIPPGDAEPFESIMFRQEEAAIFWSTVQTLAKIALEAAEKLNRQGFR